MLNVIRTAEGADYNTRVGGGKFSDLSRKPGQKVYIKSIDDYSSAEGAYQFIDPTWKEVSKKLGLKDFYPQSQDLAAVYLIKEQGAVKDILNDDFESAIHKLSARWASLPTAKGGSAYRGQKARKLEQLKKVYGMPVKETSYSPQTPQEEDSFVSVPLDFNMPSIGGIVFTGEEEQTENTTQESPTEQPQQQEIEPEDRLIQESYDEQYAPDTLQEPQYTFDLQPIEYQPIAEFQDGGIIKEDRDIINKDVSWLNNWVKNREIKGTPIPKDFKIANPEKVYIGGEEEFSGDLKNTSGYFDPYYDTVVLNKDKWKEKPGLSTHEFTHQIQDRNPYFNEYISNPITKHVKPTSYTSQPEEIHSEIMRLRQQEGYDPKKEVTREQIEAIKNLGDYNLKDINKDQLLEILNTTAYNQKNRLPNYAQNGGQIPVTPNGMWEYPEQDVIVPTSGHITMKNIDYPIFGKSLETGEIKLMQPNNNYFFKNTKNVLEIPYEKKK